MQQTQMAKRNAPKFSKSGNNQGRKPRMNMILEDDEQTDTVVIDHVTMSVADIQEQADELQAFMDMARVEVEETTTVTSETIEEIDSYGLQSVEESGLHAMQPDMEPGVCDSPPEQDAELHSMQPVELAQQGSQPTSTTETVKVNAVKSDHKSNLFIKKGRINGRDVRILLDTGASTNMITPGLASNVLLSRRLRAQRFDGTLTPAKDVRHVEAPVSMDGYFFLAMEFVEWKLPESHDVIFGKPWFKDHNPQVNWQTEEVVIPDRMQFVDVDGPSFSHNMKQGEYEQVFRVKVLLQPDVDGIPEPIFNVVGKEFKDVFPEQLPDGLPPTREVSFEVTLKKGAQPSSRAPFRMSKVEQDAFEEFVKDKLKKGWIKVLNSPWVSNIFAIPKKDPVTGQIPKRAEWLRSGNMKIPLRWVFDYRYLNSVTVIAKIPLPLIEELVDKMVGCVIYTLIDLAQGYHQMIVVKSSRPYTAFRTHKETYQWCVAPMGVAGMPGTWSRLMHKLFDKFEFVVVYLDDICVFSKSMEEHEEHLRAVCLVLRREKLFAHLAKCSFGHSQVAFLGHVVSQAGVSVDPRKTEAIAKYPTPTNRKELMSFLGLAGYYRRFISDFAELARPLRDLTKKDIPWDWTKPVEEGYLHLKLALQQAPTLKLPDFDRPFIATTDASGHCIGGVLSQKYDGADHPIAFYSKKLDRHERGWPKHEKELLAIKVATEKWRHYLHGRPFDVYTDNAARSRMLHHPRVSPKMAHFLTHFSQYTFTLHHVRGKMNVVADALSRPPPDGLEDEEEKEPRLPDVTYTVHDCTDACAKEAAQVHEHRIRSAVMRNLSTEDTHQLLDDVDLRGESRPIGIAQQQVNSVDYHFVSPHLASETKKAFQEGYVTDPAFMQQWSKGAGKEKFIKHNGLLFFKQKKGETVYRLCVPKVNELRTNVMMEFHDGTTSAHPGSRRTYLKAAQWYYWPTMDRDVREYVRTCETCARWKPSSQKKKGLLMPIPTPKECWEVVSMDFITGLPVSEGYDAILVAVDKLSKRAKYAPTIRQLMQETPQKCFLMQWLDLPKVIISDRDSKFISDFWKSLMKLMGVKLSMTTAHRAQADGQTERQNLVLEDALRCMISYHGDD
ncbi:hypothetical protein PR003_g18892 [Phytophthora rubi]|nr:hypothetical protein PR003_g18892 [Phytophthora rubi]